VRSSSCSLVCPSFSAAARSRAAEEIVDADLDTLEFLVNKSLVRHGHDRFSMLETIREYAAERLAESSDGDAIRRRHGEFFLALAEELELGAYLGILVQP
jgi:predicted ATPase